MNYCVLLAKKAVEIYINKGKIILPPEDFPKEFFVLKIRLGWLLDQLNP